MGLRRKLFPFRHLTQTYRPGNWPNGPIAAKVLTLNILGVTTSSNPRFQVINANIVHQTVIGIRVPWEEEERRTRTQVMEKEQLLLASNLTVITLSRLFQKLLVLGHLLFYRGTKYHKHVAMKSVFGITQEIVIFLIEEFLSTAIDPIRPVSGT